MGCEPSQANPPHPLHDLSPAYQDANIYHEQFMMAKTSSIFSEYHFMSFISRNQNSYLRIVKHRKSGIERVVKIFYRVKQNECVAIHEINAMKKLDHPSLARLQEYYVDSSNIYIVYEKVEGEELFSHLLGVEDRVRQNFPSIFQQLLVVLEYCHKRGYAHLNIIPENILIVKKNEGYLIKLVGFSEIFQFAERQKSEKAQKIVRRPNNRRDIYRAPEISTLETISKIDIWMAGLLLLMVITGRNLLIEIQKQEVSSVIDQWARQNPEYHKLTDLILHMLHPNSAVRFTAQQCLNHPFIKQVTASVYVWRIAVVYNFMHNFRSKNRLKKLFQMYMLHRISSIHEQTQFMVEFMNLDKNKDGKLQREQLVEGLLNSYSMSKSDAQKYVAEIFENLDRNRNNSLEYSQYLLGTTKINKITNEKNIEMVFREIDVNQNGYISKQQIRNMFYDVCLDEEVFRNPEGMSLEEFKSFMIEISMQKAKQD